MTAQLDRQATKSVEKKSEDVFSDVGSHRLYK